MGRKRDFDVAFNVAVSIRREGRVAVSARKPVVQLRARSVYDDLAAISGQLLKHSYFTLGRLSRSRRPL